MDAQEYPTGTHGAYRYSARVHPEPSPRGINGGRISKLLVTKDGKWVANYDRGWDVVPEGEHKAPVDQIIAMMEAQR